MEVNEMEKTVITTSPADCPENCGIIAKVKIPPLVQDLISTSGNMAAFYSTTVSIQALPSA